MMETTDLMRKRLKNKQQWFWEHLDWLPSLRRRRRPGWRNKTIFKVATAIGTTPVSVG